MEHTVHQFYRPMAAVARDDPIFTTTGTSQILQIHRENLPDDWDLSVMTNGRLYYINHQRQSTHWTPPGESWTCIYGLPYGFELAIDTTGRPYFVNHIQNGTSYKDPRAFIEPDDNPEPRHLVLYRDADLGFGFVAGSERPVVIRFVTENGPSEDRLLPGDEIWAINGEDVYDAAKEVVVQMIRTCQDQVHLTVCQPRSCDSSLKSALLSAAKRVRLKNNPSRVRFAEGVFIGTPPDSVKLKYKPIMYQRCQFCKRCADPNRQDSCIPLMPNVLRVFLENGQTKSFKYDNNTSVQDVIDSLKEKLGLKHVAHFALALDLPTGPRAHKLSLVRSDAKVVRIASRPGSQHTRCLFRVVFIPIDAGELCKQDPSAFEYYFKQCVNDVTHGRFAYEMRYEACLRLAALQIQQCAIDTNHSGKVSLKHVEKEYGLSAFLPTILLDNVKKKEIRKHLRYYLKRDAMSKQPQTFGNSQAALNPNASPFVDSNALGSLPTFAGTPSQQIKAKYVHMLGHLPTFGGRTFIVTFKDTNTDMIMQISPRSGISVRNTGRNFEMTDEPTLSLFFNVIKEIIVSAETEVLRVFTLVLLGDQSQELDFIVDKDDIEDLVLYIAGYYHLFTLKELQVAWDDEFAEAPVPPYLGIHNVKPSSWNYLSDNTVLGQSEHYIDLCRVPPKYYHTGRQLPLNKTIAQLSQEVVEEESTEHDPLLFVAGRIQHNDQTQISTLEEMSEFKANCTSLDATQLCPNMTLNQQESSVEPELRLRTHSFLTAKDSLKVTKQSRKSPTLDIQQILGFGFQPPNKETGIRLENVTEMIVKDATPLQSQTNEDGNSLAKEIRTAAASFKTIVPDTSSSVSGSDTESMSTPSESPIHRPPYTIKSKPTSLPVVKEPSFGLQSPDTLPCSLLSEEDLHQIISSLKLEGSQVEDLLLLFPDNFCTDKEIIDLTGANLEHDFNHGSIEPVKPPTPFRDSHQFDCSLTQASAPEHTETTSNKNVEAISNSVSQYTGLGKTTSAGSIGTILSHASSTISPSLSVLSSLIAQDIPRLPSFDHPEEFEEFLQATIIPPPPNDPRNNEAYYRNELLLQSLEQATPAPTHNSLVDTPGLVGLAGVPEGDHISILMDFDKSTHRRTNLNNFSGLEATEHEASKQQMNLGNWSGLESSEFETPAVASMTLREYAGLENVPVRRCNLRTSMRSSSLQCETVTDQMPSSSTHDTKRLSYGMPTHHMARTLTTRLKSIDLSASLGSKPMAWPKNKLDNIQAMPGTAKSGEEPRPSGSDQKAPPITGIVQVEKALPETDLKTRSPRDPLSPEFMSPNSSELTKTGRLLAMISPRFPRRSFKTPSRFSLQSQLEAEKKNQAGYGGVYVGNGSLYNPKETPTLESQTALLDTMLISADTSQLHLTPNPPVDYSVARENLSELLQQIDQSQQATSSKSPARSVINVEALKSDVLKEAQRYAAASKIFVRSVIDVCYNNDTNQIHTKQPQPARSTNDAIARNLGRAVVVLRRLNDCTRKLINLSASAETLNMKIRDIVTCFILAISAAEVTLIKPNHDPNARKLMKQSTTLAAALTAFIHATRNA